jgi:phosphate-selective porin OprO/OprP
VLTQILAAALICAPPAGSPTARTAGAPVCRFESVSAAAGQGTAKPPKKPKQSKKPKPPKSDAPAPDEEVDPKAPPDPADTGRGFRFVWRQHPSWRFGNIARVDFQAKLQEDVRASYPGAPELKDPITGENRTFDFHRNRIGVQGNLFRHIEFEIERELTEKELTEKDVLAGVTAESSWKDVSVNVSYIDDAQIQVGKFKIPFGLDQLTGVTNNDFVYRSLGARYLAPSRDIGVMVHGRFFRRGLSYWTGVFRHDGDNARSKKIQGGDETFAARIAAVPFRRVGVPGLELGGAFTVSALSDEFFLPNGLRGRTVMTQDTFHSPVYVRGRRRRWEADADWTWGPMSARSEYTYVVDQRLQQGILNDDLADALAQSWYVSGTWIVTGEDKTRPVEAAADLFRGGIGAVEVAARYERLWFGSAGEGVGERTPRAQHILQSGDRVLTLGVNWTLNRFIKLQANAIRERVEDQERSPVANGAAFWSRVLRLQFVL